MPGVRCRVDSCGNSIKGSKHQYISFHRFPKNPRLRKLWVKFTRMPGTWNPDNSYICSDHFASDDFIRNLQAELLQLPKQRRLLKRTAVPTVYNTYKNISEAKQKRIKRYEERERKRIVKELLSENERQERLAKCLADVSLEIHAYPSSTSVRSEPSPIVGSSNQSAYGLYLLGDPPYSVIAQPVGGANMQCPTLLPKHDVGCESSPSKSSSPEIIVKRVVVGSNEKPKTVILNKPIVVNERSPFIAPHNNSPPKQPPDSLSPSKTSSNCKSNPIVLLSNVSPPNLLQGINPLENTLVKNSSEAPLLSKFQNQLVIALSSQVNASPCDYIKSSKNDTFIYNLKKKVAELTCDLQNKNRIIREQRATIKKLTTQLVKYKKEQVSTSYVIGSLTGDEPPVICCDHNYAVNGEKGKEETKGQAPAGCPLPPSSEAEGAELSMMYIFPCEPGIQPPGTHFLLETDNVIVERMEYT